MTPLHFTVSKTPDYAMRPILRLLVVALISSNVAASPEEGFPWPPPWQAWQVRVCKQTGEPIQTTGVALLKDGQIAVALANGVAVLSPDGKILRQARTSSGENIAIASAGDELILAASDTLLVVDSNTLDTKASIPVGGRIYQISGNTDGSRVAVARFGATGLLVNLGDQTLKELSLSSCPRGAAWLPDGKGVAFATDAAIEVFDADGKWMQTLSYFGNGLRMNSPRLTTSDDGKWLIATDEAGAMQFWSTTFSTEQPVATFSNGGPWFSAFYASSPAKPYAERPTGELSSAEIPVLNPNPYPASEVTGIAGRPDGTVIFSTWRGDIVCWDLAKVPASRKLAKPLWERDRELIPVHFRKARAYFTPIVKEAEGRKSIVLRFESRGKVLGDYPLPGTCSSSSQVTAASSFDGRAVVVSTGTPPVKALITMEQLRATPALARSNPDALFEIQPSVYIVDGKTESVSPVAETRGISAYYLSVNAGVASFSISTNEWSGIATLDVETKKLLRTGRTDLPAESALKVFPMAGDRVAVTSRDPHLIHWMIHEQKEDPKSVGIALQNNLPFKPNGSWSSVATVSLDSDVRSAAPSPDGRHLAILTERDTLDLLAWGELKPKGCLPASGTSHSGGLLFWQDNDTLVCETESVSTTYKISRDLLKPVAFTEIGRHLGISPDGTPYRVQVPVENASLAANGYNHIVTKKGFRRVAWLPSISSGIWCEVPDRNFAAYSRDGLWVADVATGIICHGYNAPFADGMAATPEKIFTRNPNGAVFEWKLPQR